MKNRSVVSHDVSKVAIDLTSMLKNLFQYFVIAIVRHTLILCLLNARNGVFKSITFTYGHFHITNELQWKFVLYM